MESQFDLDIKNVDENISLAKRNIEYLNRKIIGMNLEKLKINLKKTIFEKYPKINIDHIFSKISFIYNTVLSDLDYYRYLRIGNNEIEVSYCGSINLWIKAGELSEYFYDLNIDRIQNINTISKLLNSISKDVDIDLPILKEIITMGTETNYINLAPFIL